MTPIDMKVVLFTDLVHHSDFDMFEGVSTGDAEYTLVRADRLIEELEQQEDEDLIPLIDELRTVPEGVLVALDG